MLKKALWIFFIASPCWATFSGYQYERVLTISSANVSNVNGVIMNMPVLVSTNDVTLSTTSAQGGRLNTTGMDLVFSTMSDCSFLLFWDTDTVQNVGVSTFNAWVQIPTLTTATLTAATFYMCYGNPGVTKYQGISTMTWTNNNTGAGTFYQGVWHISNGTTVSTLDSTVNADTATLTAMTNISSGAVDGAGAFNGSSSRMLLNDRTALQITNKITFSTWARPSTLNGKFFFAKWTSPNYAYAFYRNAANKATFFYGAGSSSVSSATINNNALQYIVYETSGTNGNVWINGVFASSVAITQIGTVASLASIGSQGTTAGFNFAGDMDEVRISSGNYNQGWITTEYNNQSAPLNFVTSGLEVNSVAINPNKTGITINGNETQIKGGKAAVF
jgi:hypothetical protein